MESAHDYLLTMPPEELDKLAKNIDRLHALLGLARLLVGGFWACLLAFGGVAVWVNTTTVALATTQRELNALRVDRAEVLKDYQIWRAKKDEIDTQIIQMLQNQAEMIKRQQMILDRVTLR
jgi:hypothetical protein